MFLASISVSVMVVVLVSPFALMISTTVSTVWVAVIESWIQNIFPSGLTSTVHWKSHAPPFTASTCAGEGDGEDDGGGVEDGGGVDWGMAERGPPMIFVVPLSSTAVPLSA